MTTGSNPSRPVWLATVWQQGRIVDSVAPAVVRRARVLRWGSVAQRAVGPNLLVVGAPGADLAARLGKIGEPVFVEALVAHASVEALGECVLDRLAGPDDMQLD